MEKDFLKIANDYRYNREFSEAIFYYNEILKSKKIKYEEKIQSYKALAQTYKLQKDYKKNIQYLDELVTYIQSLKLKASVKSKLEIENSILLARAKWTEHHADQAKALLKKVLAKKDIAKYKHKANAEAYWIIARIYEEEKKYSTSLEYLAKAVAIGDSPILETALWNQAWIERKEQKLEASNQSLILLQNTTKNLYLKNKFIYWQAQNLKDLGKTQEANDIWQKLSQEDTHGYYGILSHRALNKKFSRIQSNNDYDKTLTELKINKHKKSYFEWLVAVGEFSVAQNYLKELNLNTKSQQELLSFLESQAKAQNFAVLFEQILKLDEVNRREILKIKPEFLFPRPYYSSVSEAANKYGVHSSLIYSIIRQESSFNPSARSHADAFGLMQLLPTEARRLASQNDLSIEQDEDLFIPERNIFLGTAYLRELFDRFHGQFILSVASYNAAEDAVKSWLKTRYKGDPISFIEDIPYQETQGYVKIILRNLVFYQRLAAPDQEHDFPEWTLQNLDDFASL